MPRRLPVAIVLAAAGLGCARARAPEWTCADYGAERRCSAPLVPPSPRPWTCHAAGGTLACGRPGPGGGGAGWDCASTGDAVVCLAARAAEPPEPVPDGWQCFVDAGSLICDARRTGNAPWVCAGDRCVERYPDRPSADEWECIEGDGRVLCRGRFVDAVGPRWHCVRRGERFLCLDPDPDFPDAAGPGGWRCLYDDSLKTGRACSRNTAPPGGACPGRRVDGRCFLVEPEPECWFDADCGPGKACRVGRCVLG